MWRDPRGPGAGCATRHAGAARARGCGALSVEIEGDSLNLEGASPTARAGIGAEAAKECWTSRGEASMRTRIAIAAIAVMIAASVASPAAGDHPGAGCGITNAYNVQGNGAPRCSFTVHCWGECRLALEGRINGVGSVSMVVQLRARPGQYTWCAGVMSCVAPLYPTSNASGPTIVDCYAGTDVAVLESVWCAASPTSPE